MTQEEKAKSYDEALERAKSFQQKFGGDYAGYIFPELRESEDERIRKELINFILYKAKGVSEEQEHSWVAYLYKQKINTEGDFGRGYDCGYEACLNSHGAEWFEKHNEHRPTNSEKPKELSEEQLLEEAAEKFARFYDNGTCDGIAQDGFIAGAKWQKEQMLKGARNHFVYNILSGNDMKKMIGIYNDEVSCKPGDVVRVIVLPKEDQTNG